VGRFDGAPLAVQLVAARYGEPVALAAAAALEAAGPVDHEALWADPWW
jgi:Asp-tRNA(Asn)/Glu-tRNA(Gln) amidotransferase A subunit family amidase